MSHALLPIALLALLSSRLSLIFTVQFVTLVGSMDNMPDTFTAFSDGLSWAMLQFPAPGVPIPTGDDDDASDDGMTNSTVLPLSSRQKKGKLAGTVFWNGLALIGILAAHISFLYFMFKKEKPVPDVFSFPAMELKLVTLSLPGLLSTSMAVMADKNIGAGYTCLGTLVVLGCLAFMAMCMRVLHILEKRKPVRFVYADDFEVGFLGETASYRDAPLIWKALSLLRYKKISLGEWETQTEEFVQHESHGWDGFKDSLLPTWTTFRMFGEPVRTSEMADQFHKNWSPLYSSFRGDKGKINYIFEMGSVFFMLVRLVCLVFCAFNGASCIQAFHLLFLF